MKISIPGYGTFEIPANKLPELVQFIRSIAVQLPESTTKDDGRHLLI